MSSSKKILVVDDDPIFRLIAKKLLEKSHLFDEIVFQENGLEAMKYLKSLNPPDKLPDIILLDIEMPIMNGWSFLENYQQLPQQQRQDISVYTVSSSIALEDKNKAASFPDIKSYITKPLTLEIVMQLAEGQL
ncbi:hypothetical protein GCM10027051_11860 [Niabella terrae]